MYYKWLYVTIHSIWQQKNTLKENRPNIFCSNSAAYIIDTFTRGYWKTYKYKLMIEKARVLTVFLRMHHDTPTSHVHLQTQGSSFGRELPDLQPLFLT